MENLKRKLLSLVCSGTPMTDDSFIKYLNVYFDEDKQSLRFAINDLITDGVLILSDGVYHLLRDEDHIVGVFKGNEKGFGFVETIDSDEDDFYVYHMNVNGALDGDLVLSLIHI